MSDLIEIRDAARAFIAERDWEQFQDPKSVVLALVGEVGELAELLQWLPADAARDLAHEEPLHTRLSEEMADVLVYLVGLADQCGVDLGVAALAKIEASSCKHPVEASRGIAPTRVAAKNLDSTKVSPGLELPEALTIVEELHQHHSGD